jgi:hypothetical protein
VWWIDPDRDNPSPHISQTFLVGVQSRSGVSLAQALIGHRFQDGDYGSE